MVCKVKYECDCHPVKCAKVTCQCREIRHPRGRPHTTLLANSLLSIAGPETSCEMPSLRVCNLSTDKPSRTFDIEPAISILDNQLARRRDLASFYKKPCMFWEKEMINNYTYAITLHDR